MLCLLISISISPRKTALTVSLSLTWIWNNLLSPSPTGELLRNFFLRKCFKDNRMFFLSFFLSFLIYWLTPTRPTLEVYHKKNTSHKAALTQWHQPTLSEVFGDVSFSSWPATVSPEAGSQSVHTTASPTCSALVSGKGWMWTGERMDVCDVCSLWHPRLLELVRSLQRYSTVGWGTNLSPEKMERKNLNCSGNHQIG